MFNEFDPTLGAGAEIAWEASARAEDVRRGMLSAGLVTIWEVQSHVAAIALVAMVTLAPLWATLLIMIGWAVVATAVYNLGRRNGLPDLLAARLSGPPADPRRWRGWLGATALAVVRFWLAGLQASVYCLVFGSLVSRAAATWPQRGARLLVLALGLTLFGVTTAHHLLRRAGLPEREVLRYSFLGPFLNVPYRAVLSLVLVNTVLGLAGTLPG